MDRGAWGLEVLILLAAWKLAMPQYITLLRGNHESTTCTRLYGFHAEMQVRSLRKLSGSPDYGAPAVGFRAGKEVSSCVRCCG